MKSSNQRSKPSSFLEHELLYNEKFELNKDEIDLEIGKAKILKEGRILL